MYVLAKIMALFWVFAEGAILLCLRWGYLRWLGKGAGQRPWILLSAGGFVLLGLWTFWGEGLLARILTDAPSVKLYRWSLWNFFCTLWVVLEGCIMIYVVRVYRALKGAGRREGGPGTALLTAALFLLFLLYYWGLGETALRRGMDVVGVYNASVFYLRICGLLWIGFEWVVAVYGWKTYALLKSGEGKIA